MDYCVQVHSSKGDALLCALLCAACTPQHVRGIVVHENNKDCPVMFADCMHTWPPSPRRDQHPRRPSFCSRIIPGRWRRHQWGWVGGVGVDACKTPIHNSTAPAMNACVLMGDRVRVGSHVLTHGRTRFPCALCLLGPANPRFSLRSRESETPELGWYPSVTWYSYRRPHLRKLQNCYEYDYMHNCGTDPNLTSEQTHLFPIGS
jgi:hypothetical protein